MKNKFKSISSTLSMLLIAVIIVSLIGLIWVFISLMTPKVIISSVSKPIVDCQRGFAKLYIEYVGKTNLTKTNLKVFIDGTELKDYLYNLNDYGSYAEIEIPLGYGKREDNNEILLTAYGSSYKFLLTHGCGKVQSIFIPLEFRNLSLVAYSSPHWVVIDYVNGKYLIYRSTNGDLTAEEGPIEGNIPIYSNLYNFTIQTSWSSWDSRPVDSPVLIFKNPDLTNTWIFNWTDPHGTFRFRIYPVQNAIDDMLIFWEDLFNPFSPPSSLDDWKDHVVRVTILPNNTYRIAVHLAKGGYKHQFYVFTSSPNPLEGRLVYEKPYNQAFSNVNNGFYDEVYYYIVSLQ